MSTLGRGKGFSPTYVMAGQHSFRAMSSGQEDALLPHHLCPFTNVMPSTCHLSRSYKKLAEDVQPGSAILCADGSIVLVRANSSCTHRTGCSYLQPPALHYRAWL